MTTTIKADRGWGKVRDPETGEDVTVSEPTDVPDEQADRLEAEYRGVIIVDEDAGGDDAGLSESAPESREELAALDWQELRQLATDADTDDVNGRSSKDEIIQYFAAGNDSEA